MTLRKKPQLLDLFCGVGGAAKGYSDAGFDVTGVDHVAQSRYPYTFIQADALEYVTMHGHEYDAIHASPPCQRYSTLNNGTWGNASGHPDLIEPTRAALITTGKSYVLENVPGSPLRTPLLLCGSMFDLHVPEGYLQRHRLFESNVHLMAPGACHHRGQAIGVYGHGRGGGPLKGRSADARMARVLMGMPWAHRDGLSQAIPPAYTYCIGLQLRAQL